MTTTKHALALDKAAREAGYKDFADAPPHLNFEIYQRASQIYAEWFAEWYFNSEWSTARRGWYHLETHEVVTTTELRQRFDDDET